MGPLRKVFCTARGHQVRLMSPEYVRPYLSLRRRRKTIGTPRRFSLWNSTYIQDAIDQLTYEGWSINEGDIARVWPLFKYINFLGRYAFDLSRAIALSETLLPNRTPA